jgi:hypothetical protein
MYFTPSLSFYSKTGLGIGATTVLINDSGKLNPYQVNLTGSYDYFRNRKFITGIALTKFFTKKNLDFYNSPLANEVYAYFTYKRLWFKPSVALSYGWGSRSDYTQQQEYIYTLQLRLNGFTQINTEEKVRDFNVITSVRHDFYWIGNLKKGDYFRLTPQLVFISGTQQFGFNQTSNTYATIPRTGSNVLYSTDNVYLDNSTYFQPISMAVNLKAEYAIGKFFIQPQFILDYYFPAKENNFTTGFIVNTGFIF